MGKVMGTLTETLTETVTETVPETVLETVTLRWEPCGAYDADHECAFGSCVRCGWPCDDHGIAGNELDDHRYAQAA